jgi:alpha-ketoglutarate-dependent taurine dioxygenase
MLYVTFNDQPPGQTFTAKKQFDLRIQATLDSANPITSIEILRNGDVARTLKPTNAKTEAGAYRTTIDHAFDVTSSAWFAVRCYETLPNGRTRFAHTAPVYVDIPGKPIRPKEREVRYLINRMEWEIENNTGVLKPEHNDEYRQALKIYQDLLKTAR